MVKSFLLQIMKGCPRALQNTLLVGISELTEIAFHIT